MRKPLCVLVALAVVAAFVTSTPIIAQAGGLTNVGTLNCTIYGSISFIVTSQKSMTCIFTPAQPGPREMYTGMITKLGLDLGATAGGQMVWAVLASTNREFGALAGSYGGASAEATVGAGIGANVLVGRTVTLQPISLQGQTGLDVAVGFANLELISVR